MNENIKKCLEKWYIVIPLILILTPLILWLINPNIPPSRMGNFTTLIIIVYLFEKYVINKNKKELNNKK